ncbi:hypothetical protein GMOD_00009574 [Pyrenophora seminiperda CCB06]|uniref:F-box domain-containing protein n=1 Tax=Pyrenophora seminiperda CCB06 TaxID=1302712 RepID=A0A3M7MFC1_9PLEO|nr:hypothetical protein GMOD_00009574 [Pyrenophora seminiperda CCB06]
MAAEAPSPFLALPRELRDNILGYLTLPHYVYTSTSIKHTRHLYQSRRSSGNTYVDTRIYLPSHPPGNILGTCQQLRQESLEHHVRLLTAQSSQATPVYDEQPMSNVLADRLGAEFAEEAERACDDATLRITLEVQRSLRGVHGYYVPVREELSPRFLALLPLMDKTKRLKLAIWPGFEWWNGDVVKPEEASKPNSASIAISKILHHLPCVKELEVNVLMQAYDGADWDLPSRKWENIQPWLDAPIAPNMEGTLEKITRKLICAWKPVSLEPFYVQYEIRQSPNTWKVDRKGDMGTPTVLSFIDPNDSDDMNFIQSLVIEESFVRTD